LMFFTVSVAVSSISNCDTSNPCGSSIVFSES
jgi:hypothetical protein